MSSNRLPVVCLSSQTNSADTPTPSRTERMGYAVLDDQIDLAMDKVTRRYDFCGFKIGAFEHFDHASHIGYPPVSAIGVDSTD